MWKVVFPPSYLWEAAEMVKIGMKFKPFQNSSLVETIISSVHWSFGIIIKFALMYQKNLKV